MFDFRYHALSLVAVFLALGIGILLGSTIGDNLASQANKDLSSSLRGDLLKARQDARDASSNVSQRDRVIQAAFPRIVGDRLRGKTIAIVASGKLPRTLEGNKNAQGPHNVSPSARKKMSEGGRKGGEK